MEGHIRSRAVTDNRSGLRMTTRESTLWQVALVTTWMKTTDDMLLEDERKTNVVETNCVVIYGHV